MSDEDTTPVEGSLEARLAQSAEAVKGQAVRYCLSVLAPTVDRSAQDYRTLLQTLEDVVAHELGQQDDSAPVPEASNEAAEPSQ